MAAVQVVCSLECCQGWEHSSAGGGPGGEMAHPSDVPMSQLAQDHVPQRPAARNDPALAVVFLGRWAMAVKQA